MRRKVKHNFGEYASVKRVIGGTTVLKRESSNVGNFNFKMVITKSCQSNGPRISVKLCHTPYIHLQQISHTNDRPHHRTPLLDDAWLVIH